MLQIWVLYDYYFVVCAYIVAKSYMPTFGLATICVHEKVETIQSPNLQHLFMLSVTLCVQNFVANGQL